jgi:hypothetical protein
MFPTVPQIRPPQTEQQYLERQVAESRQAIRNSLAGLKTGVRQAANLQAWARRHPWGVVGVAAAAGLATAAAVLPRKPRPVSDEELRTRLSRLLDAVEDPRAPDPCPRETASESSPPRASMARALRRSLLALLKAEVLTPVLAELLQAGSDWTRGTPPEWWTEPDTSPKETSSSPEAPAKPASSGTKSPQDAEQPPDTKPSAGNTSRTASSSDRT